MRKLLIALTLLFCLGQIGCEMPLPSDFNSFFNLEQQKDIPDTPEENQ